MSKFMPGDKVSPVSASRCTYIDDMAELVGKTLIVRSIAVDAKNEEVVEAGLPGEEWFWHPDDLRHVTPEEVKAPEKKKRKPTKVRHGDLVIYRGEIGVVHDIYAFTNGDHNCCVALMTGDLDQHYTSVKTLTRIGSIRKLVKRLKQELENKN